MATGRFSLELVSDTLGPSKKHPARVKGLIRGWRGERAPDAEVDFSRELQGGTSCVLEGAVDMPAKRQGRGAVEGLS